jgi:hypothetical protein
MSWLMSNWVTIVVTVLTIIGAASVAVKAIAPFTSTKADDKVASFLDKVHGWLSRLALNGTAAKK